MRRIGILEIVVIRQARIRTGAGNGRPLTNFHFPFRTQLFQTIDALDHCTVWFEAGIGFPIGETNMPEWGVVIFRHKVGRNTYLAPEWSTAEYAIAI